MKAKNKRVKKALAFFLCLTMCFVSSTLFVSAADIDTLQWSRIEELPDGGKIYVYIIDGTENMFPVPPDGFHPLTATDEALETYGFPPRPSDPDELSKWIENMSAWKQTPVPEIKRTERIHGFMQPASLETISPMAVTGTRYSNNWSGYVATGGTNALRKYRGFRTAHNSI